MKQEWKNHLTHWGRWSTGTEVKRGLLHFVVGLAAWMVLHPLYLGDLVVWVALVIVACIFVAAEATRKWARESDTQMARWSIKIINQFTRESEKNGDLTTTIQTILGCAVAWVIGPRWICALSGLLLGVVDPVSKFGKRYPMGPRFQNGKSRGGMLFGLCAGIIAAFWVSAFHGISPLFPANLGVWHVVVVYTAGVLVAPICEFFGGKWDNFLLPVGTAILMSVVDIVLPF